jgi:diguanylate cyclase (GGDEF)-like protein
MSVKSVKSVTATIYRIFETTFSVPRDCPRLLTAQYRCFAKQIPILYLILTANTLVVAVVYQEFAPFWLSTLYPAALSIICLTRLIMWWRANSHVLSPEAARDALVLTNRLGPALTIAFSLWAFGLFQYGDTECKALVAFYMATTIVGCIVCLMHLRSTTFGVAVIGNAAFVVFFLSSGDFTFAAMFINATLASTAVLTMALIYSRDFERMIAAQSETEALGRENSRLAHVDMLTDLPNRRYFFQTLGEELQQARESGHRLALGLIDLDGFKTINDRHGHSIGDMLLTEVARRLSAIASDQDAWFSRLGGDEFAVLIRNANDDSTLLKLAQEICDTLSIPFQLNSIAAHVGASIGLAIYPDMAGDATRLFDQADYALYASKRNGRGRPTLFSAVHEREMSRDGQIEDLLAAAALETELAVVFQPIVDVRTNRTIAFEALARWTNPELGRVSPSVFIPVAEKTGIISRITTVLFAKAIASAQHWPADVRLSFNLSAIDIVTQQTMIGLVAVLSKASFDPRRIDFEITETAMIQDFVQARAGIEMLRALGCGISLDDFGTGFASLSQLHSLPLTKIKVDRSFVTNVHENPSSYKIVKSLLALSEDMGLSCIMEGVETEEELLALQRMGCCYVQGYRFSRPLSEAEAMEFVEHSDGSGRRHLAS